MPRTSFPPTPGPSTEILGKENALLSQLEASFTLPPAAMGSGSHSERGSVVSTSVSSKDSDSSYRPLSPPSPATAQPASRRKSSMNQNATAPKEDFALPPPPTRPRKIIQMKPRRQEEQQMEWKPNQAAPIVAKSSAAVPPPTMASTPSTGGKRKQNSNTTAAGRKIARKTAHSLIERRRRSKMNEEFGVLKDMIPACRGQEMHKLAILQASIEYLRYLEQCVTDLKAVTHSPPGSSRPMTVIRSPTQATAQSHSHSRPRNDMQEEDDDDDEDEEGEEEDVENKDTEMTDVSHQVSPVLLPLTNISSHRITPQSLPCLPSAYSITSPSLNPTFTTANSTHTISSPTLSATASYSQSQRYSLSGYTSSALSSPSFNPLTSGQISALSPLTQTTSLGSTSHHLQQQPYGYPSHFSLTSPALGPQRDADHEHEATAALLMLTNDRRGTVGSLTSRRSSSNSGGAGDGGGVGDLRGERSRGMSVKDLLSG